MKIGLDIGSTTIKCVLLSNNDEFLYSTYERHYSQITKKTAQILMTLKEKIPQGEKTQLIISGSAGMGLAEKCKIPFIQEVYATRITAKKLIPQTDVIIELGGEDAKILFLGSSLEVRMNGSCAGGTGAFIDQMATLMGITPDEMNSLAMESEKIYTIASRCGVFAKSDIQPLLNQGARKSDVAASVFYSVVNQTIAGLAQGRPICGNVAYLGGPLTFLSQLRNSFDKVLKLNGICPENSLYYVALGAAFCADSEIDIDDIIMRINHYSSESSYNSMEPLFASADEYSAFLERHNSMKVAKAPLENYTKRCCLGIDAGSTTVKAVLLGEDNEIIYEKYMSNSGNPVPLVRDMLLEIYERNPNIIIASGAVTGYGEDIIKNAFNIDFGVVETVAHFTAARNFMPDVEFIIDIGGQDMKCFKIHNGAIDNIYLNEACSSGCGSFLQTFANALGYSIEDFAKLGIYAKKPVDLGSRCTVFMNSSVKQAQKDGASIEDISAGLSISIVKNALYKVIRPSSLDALGKRIVVQGGTFYNDAVLRAFEQELHVDVVRPEIAGLMGAFGAALYARKYAKSSSTIMSKDALERFEHCVTAVSCGLCSNNCRLTINTFLDSSDKTTRRFISGNRCERPITKKSADDSLNIYAYKLQLLHNLMPKDGKRGTIGLPLGLNMYELLPFWHTLFTDLGFKVIVSPLSNRKLYLRGQTTIPSDTVCFPAKLLHGHVDYLIEQGVETIFYPCMSYNFNEHMGDNNYNCPVVAYYPEVIGANTPKINKVRFLKPYLGIHRPADFPKKLYAALREFYPDLTENEVKSASKKAYSAHEDFLSKIRTRGEKIIQNARFEHKPIIVLAGRPYHADPETNHGIDKLIAGFGAAVISEDVLSNKVSKFKVGVLNQWTYHSRLYSAAKYVVTQKDMNLVQLVSFGCGVDAITTDEVREILEHDGKIYTQIKIDEITNLGAVKIRLRSLFAAAYGQEGSNISYELQN